MISDLSFQKLLEHILIFQQKREYLKDLKNQMEVKSKEKVDRNDDEKADAVGKDTARNEHNERLQSTRERKLQQLRYSYANAIIYTPMNAYHI